MLSKEQILKAADIKTETLTIPEWGGKVKIRMLTGAERDHLESITFLLKEKKVQDNTRAAWAAFSVVDDAGKRVFTENDIEDLGKKSAAALDRIFTAALKLNKVTDKDIEEIQKNSGATPAGGSISN